MKVFAFEDSTIIKLDINLRSMGEGGDENTILNKTTKFQTCFTASLIDKINK